MDYTNALYETYNLYVGLMYEYVQAANIHRRKISKQHDKMYGKGVLTKTHKAWKVYQGLKEDVFNTPLFSHESNRRLILRSVFHKPQVKQWDVKIPDGEWGKVKAFMSYDFNKRSGLRASLGASVTSKGPLHTFIIGDTKVTYNESTGSLKSSGSNRYFISLCEDTVNS
jgi:hypothetical protein